MNYQPWYRTMHWGAWIALFITSWINYFTNGGKFSDSPEGWAIFGGSILLWLVSAYNTVTGANKAALPNGSNP